LTLWIDCLKWTTEKVFKRRLDFPFKKEIKTMDRVAKMQGQSIVETTVRFPI